MTDYKCISDKPISAGSTSDKKITIAIDGYSSCGKSTLAKDLAKKLDYIFIDSGAMYRGIALYAYRNNWASKDTIEANSIVNHLSDISLKFCKKPQDDIHALFLNDENVENEIRNPHISEIVSKVAQIPEVRTKLVQEQRNMGVLGGIVMDGRDIGSVVFPNAELKLFITADINVRTQRRHSELERKGVSIDQAEVEKNLLERDHADSTRKVAPLIQVEDAVVIDNSDLTMEEQLDKAYNYAQNLMKEAVK